MKTPLLDRLKEAASAGAHHACVSQEEADAILRLMKAAQHVLRFVDIVDHPEDVKALEALEAALAATGMVKP